VKGEARLFAFPGNPVSTLVGFKKYFLPWLYKGWEVEQKETYVELAADVSFKPNLTYFAQARVSNKNGILQAVVDKGNGSGDMVSLMHVDGFVELPTGRETYHCGEVFPFIPL
jgi:molybdopterin molybdotransferase